MPGPLDSRMNLTTDTEGILWCAQAETQKGRQAQPQPHTTLSTSVNPYFHALMVIKVSVQYEILHSSELSLY